MYSMNQILKNMHKENYNFEHIRVAVISEQYSLTKPDIHYM